MWEIPHSDIIPFYECISANVSDLLIVKLTKCYDNHCHPSRRKNRDQGDEVLNDDAAAMETGTDTDRDPEADYQDARQRNILLATPTTSMEDYETM
jgi:hypothetical protein